MWQSLKADTDTAEGCFWGAQSGRIQRAGQWVKAWEPGARSGCQPGAGRGVVLARCPLQSLPGQSLLSIKAQPPS